LAASCGPDAAGRPASTSCPSWCNPVPRAERLPPTRIEYTPDRNPLPFAVPSFCCAWRPPLLVAVSIASSMCRFWLPFLLPPLCAASGCRFADHDLPVLQSPRPPKDWAFPAARSSGTRWYFCSGGIPVHSRQVKTDSGPMVLVSVAPRGAAHPPEACPFDRPPSPQYSCFKAFPASWRTIVERSRFYLAPRAPCLRSAHGTCAGTKWRVQGGRRPALFGSLHFAFCR
jgi:hypothetical protein